MNAPRPSIEARLREVRERIRAAEVRAGRPEGSVTLIGVVKTLPAGVVAEAVALGLMDLGENRVQEAEEHQRHVARDAVRWHMIGHLQKNKLGRALAGFDLLHGVDDLDLAAAIERRAAAIGRRVRVLIEVNISGEASKFGFEPEAVPAACERLADSPHLELAGLMTVGAPVERADDARPGFVRLRVLRDEAARRCGLALPELSMGMSNDYEVAIAEGATMVRVGTALFGARH